MITRFFLPGTQKSLILDINRFIETCHGQNRWGKINKTNELICGRTRINFSRPSNN